ncbi:hypothetical protein CRM22_008745 [Opisthorchis felineus]|uniref:Syntaxin N-terminal domain-containing protein n=1 Tax=Opisthorchis felineus TaxID=147828 RepID=A0A4S2L9W1_OPIFE|nr:hypothetical protein CRM22_008745 [Opisthorchis felineus]
MATRSLTESFAFMRNNAFQNRQFFSDQKTNDQEALVPKSRDVDIEKTSRSRVPQEWQSLVNSVQYTFTLIHQKMKELVALHNRHLMATNLDDNLDEDQEIEHQTKELTEVFSLSHRQLGKLSALRRSPTLWQGSQSQKLSENVLSSLARTLQDLSLAFRKAQSEYLNKLKSRDDRIQGYLSWGPLLDNNSTGLDDFGDQEYQVNLKAALNCTRFLLSFLFVTKYALTSLKGIFPGRWRLYSAGGSLTPLDTRYFILLSPPSS